MPNLLTAWQDVPGMYNPLAQAPVEPFLNPPLGPTGLNAPSPLPLQTAMPNVRLGPGVVMKQLAGTTDLYGTAVPGGHRVLHTILNEGQPIGEVSVTIAGKNAIVNWIGEELNKQTAGQGLNQLLGQVGPAGLRSLARQFKEFYPNVKQLIGEHIGGSGGKGLAAGQGGHMMSLDLEKLAQERLQGLAAKNRLTLTQEIAKNRAASATPDAEQQFGLNMMRRFYR